MNSLAVVGRDMSHAFLVSGVFPDRISFPSLAAILLGPDNYSGIAASGIFCLFACGITLDV